MLPAGWIDLRDLTEILLDGLRPFPSPYLRGFNLDAFARRLLRIFLVTREMDIVLRESDTSLVPATGERNLERFQDRRLARVVRTDEHGRVAELDV